jgi:N-acetylglucosamine kinase
MGGSARKVVLAIDGGGTSTRSLAIDSSGMILGGGEGGPSNHILAPWDVVRASIEAAINGGVEQAGLTPDDVCCISLGTAGIGPNGEGKEVIEDLASEILPAEKVTATGDMVIAYHGAIMGDCGVVVNAGTGSVVYGVSPRGASRQVGGWGHVLGDEGSAYDIAVRALRAGARHFDGRGPFTTLVDRLPEALEVSDFIQVAFKIYGLEMSREDISALARVVGEEAKGGDAVSQQILRSAGEELALAVAVAIRELGLEEAAVPVSYIGSVFASGECIVRPFAEAVMMRCPRATVLPPKFPAVIGDAVSARHRAAAEVSGGHRGIHPRREGGGLAHLGTTADEYKELPRVAVTNRNLRLAAIVVAFGRRKAVSCRSLVCAGTVDPVPMRSNLLVVVCQRRRRKATWSGDSIPSCWRDSFFFSFQQR